MDRAPAGVRVVRFPQLLDPIEVDTFCSGTAALWASARASSAAATSRSHTPSRSGCTSSPTARAPARCPRLRRRLRPVGGRPPRARAAAPPGGAATGRPRPTVALPRRDLDPAGHVNNAVYWAALEEELVADEPAGGLSAEVEHRAAAGTGEGAVLHDGPMRWITGADGAVAATFRLAA